MCAWWGDLKNNLIQTLLEFQRKMSEKRNVGSHRTKQRHNTHTWKTHTPLIKHIILIGHCYLDTYAANKWTLWWHNKVCVRFVMTTHTHTRAFPFFPFCVCLPLFISLFCFTRFLLLLSLEVECGVFYIGRTCQINYNYFSALYELSLECVSWRLEKTDRKYIYILFFVSLLSRTLFFVSSFHPFLHANVSLVHASFLLLFRLYCGEFMGHRIEKITIKTVLATKKNDLLENDRQLFYFLFLAWISSLS